MFLWSQVAISIKPNSSSTEFIVSSYILFFLIECVHFAHREAGFSGSMRNPVTFEERVTLAIRGVDTGEKGPRKVCCMIRARFSSTFDICRISLRFFEKCKVPVRGLTIIFYSFWGFTSDMNTVRQAHSW